MNPSSSCWARAEVRKPTMNYCTGPHSNGQAPFLSHASWPCAVIKGWDVGVATMKKGERAMLRCLPEYAYGEKGSPPSIPANATLNFEVSLPLLHRASGKMSSLWSASQAQAKGTPASVHGATPVAQRL